MIANGLIRTLAHTHDMEISEVISWVKEEVYNYCELNDGSVGIDGMLEDVFGVHQDYLFDLLDFVPEEI